MSFFKAALKEKVICVPGEFFDINPGKRRSGRPSRFRQYVRFSFGPELKVVEEGVSEDTEDGGEVRGKGDGRREKAEDVGRYPKCQREVSLG